MPRSIFIFCTGSTGIHLPLALDKSKLHKVVDKLVVGEFAVYSRSKQLGFKARAFPTFYHESEF